LFVSDIAFFSPQKQFVFYMPQTGYIKSIVGLRLILRELHFFMHSYFLGLDNM